MSGSEANKIQIGGDHYKAADGKGEEHWDRVSRLKLDYFQACITKYVERCWKKNGLQDLQKAQHFLQKYIELHSPKIDAPQLPFGAETCEVGRSIGKKACDPFVNTANAVVCRTHMCFIRRADGGSEPGPSYVNQDRC